MLIFNATLFFLSKQIIFEYVRGTSYSGDIAVDDIAFPTGSCMALVPTSKVTFYVLCSSKFYGEISGGVFLSTHFMENRGKFDFHCGEYINFLHWLSALYAFHDTA